MRLGTPYDVSGVLGVLSMLPRVWKRRELRLRPARRPRPTSRTALWGVAASAHAPAQMHGQDSGALLSHTGETKFDEVEDVLVEEVLVEEVLVEELGFDSSNLLHRLCGPSSIPCCSWRWWQVEQLLVEQLLGEQLLVEQLLMEEVGAVCAGPISQQLLGELRGAFTAHSR